MRKQPQQVPDSMKPRILETCIQLMQKRGFDAVGMRDIATSLKIQAPSLYHHFASKERLATAAMEHFRVAQRERLRSLDAREGRADKLLGYVDMFAEILADESRLCLCLVMLRAQHAISSETLSEARKFVRQNVNWLERTIDAPNARSPASKQRAVAEVIFSGLEGLMLIASVEKSPERYFRSRANDLLNALGLT